MEIEVASGLRGGKRTAWENLLTACGLQADEQVERTVLLWDGELLAATGSRQRNVLKCIAVDPAYQGEGLMATLITQLRQDAFDAGESHLFLYTKPSNRWQFQSMFFYPIVQTEHVLLMENRKNGAQSFLEALPAVHKGQKVGACVMNCNPFTLGHRYLIRQAAEECDWVYVFVLSEDASRFSAKDRLAMVQRGTADIPNVTVYPTGPYLISSATFPTYFLKNREQAGAVYCQLDMEVFTTHFVPKFAITHRYVGTEPLSPMTCLYNASLKEFMPARGVCVREIPRVETDGAPISATTVRSLLDAGEWDALKKYLPSTTIAYLQEL